MNKYLTVDPGKTNVGWALHNEKGEVQAFGAFKQDEFFDWLEQQDYEVMIIEIYRSRPGAINYMSKGETAQCIGVCKREARKKKAKIVEQESTALGIGLRFLGLADTYKDANGKFTHVPDKVSALAHAEYYLRQARVK